MIGILGFCAIWAAGLWFKWPRALGVMLMVFWWALVTLSTGFGITVFGGDMRIWALLGPVAVLIGVYRKGLAWLRAKARPPVQTPESDSFSSAETNRYARHILLPEIGGLGQQRLKGAKVLVVGAGGLGAPALYYLAACGIGTIGVIDADVVEASNLQRQIIHSDARLGMAKVHSAEIAMKALNPFVNILPYRRRIDAENAEGLIAEFDLVLDGTDNFDTRYLVNQACVAQGKPLIAAALTQWEGQISLYDPARGGACYECLFPTRPAAGLVPACAEAGVAAPLPGILGSMMAMEAVKYLTRAGQGLRGRLLIHDALYTETRVITTKPRADCPICAGRGA